MTCVESSGIVHDVKRNAQEHGTVVTYCGLKFKEVDFENGIARMGIILTMNEIESIGQPCPMCFGLCALAGK